MELVHRLTLERVRLDDVLIGTAAGQVAFDAAAAWELVYDLEAGANLWYNGGPVARHTSSRTEASDSDTAHHHQRIRRHS